MAGHEACGIGCEKHRGARQLLELAEPLHWGTKQKFPTALRSVEQSGIQVRAQYARNERVNTNSRPGPFDRQRFRERSNARFAGAIRGNFMEPNKRRKRADIDDAAVALLDHVPAEHAASPQSSLQICFEDGIDRKSVV